MNESLKYYSTYVSLGRPDMIEAFLKTVKKQTNLQTDLHLLLGLIKLDDKHLFVMHEVSSSLVHTSVLAE